MQSRSNRKKKRKWLRITGIVLLLLFIGFGAYVYSIYRSLANAVDTMHEPIDRKSEKRTEEIIMKDQDPFSVLLLGVDEREGDRGRSDTIVVLTVNPKQNSIKMVSIPRDTRTEIVGKGIMDKINHAYAFGKEEMSMDTVENFLDIPIDYFVRVNMEGFKDIVDAVGGITVNNNMAFSSGGHTFNEGPITLNGEQALSFVRMRKEDPQGDFGRQERQRQVILGVVKKGVSFQSITRFDDIFEALRKNVRTNLTFEEIKDIQSNYKDAAKSVEQLQLTGKGQMIDSIYYQIIPDEEVQKVQQVLKDHLEI